ncbi:hypothetical protein ACEQPO_00100 [Bacillus sp. SL00103]
MAKLSDEENTWVRKLIALYHEQLSYGAEIVELTELFFKEQIESIIKRQRKF